MKLADAHCLLFDIVRLNGVFKDTSKKYKIVGRVWLKKFNLF